MLTYHSTAEEIARAKPDTAVLPIGSIEQHGPHLPVGTDWLLANDAAGAIGEKIGAYVLPALPVSTCREHRGGAGSVWMNGATLIQTIKDIAESLKAQGFRRLVLYVGHGGVFVAGPVAREINSDNADFKVIRVDVMNLFTDPAVHGILECPNNLHACEFETSLMLHLHGALVRRERIEDCVPDVPRDYLNYGTVLQFSKNGVWGKPSLATREKGEALFRALVDKAVEYIRDVNKVFER